MMIVSTTTGSPLWGTNRMNSIWYRICMEQAAGGARLSSSAGPRTA
jgi:hypothetical protein